MQKAANGTLCVRAQLAAMLGIGTEFTELSSFVRRIRNFCYLVRHC